MGESDDLYRSLGRLEAKMDTVVDAYKKTCELLAEQDKRLQALEKTEHTGKAFFAAIAGIAGAVASNITSIFGYFK